MPPAGIRGYTIVGVGWRRAVPPIAEEQTGNGRDEGRDRHTVSEGVAFCWKCDRVALPVVISRESVGGAVIPFWVPRMTASASAGLAGLPPGGASIFGP